MALAENEETPRNSAASSRPERARSTRRKDYPRIAAKLPGEWRMAVCSGAVAFRGIFARKTGAGWFIRPRKVSESDFPRRVSGV